MPITDGERFKERCRDVALLRAGESRAPRNDSHMSGGLAMNSCRLGSGEGAEIATNLMANCADVL